MLHQSGWGNFTIKAHHPMKHLFSILMLVALSSSVQAQQLNTLLKKAKETIAANGGQLGPQDIAAGLKEALAIGAQFATKRLPTDLLIELVDKLTFPVLLLGGPEDVEVAEKIVAETIKTNVYSTVGKCAIHESAWLVKNASALVTHDTGLMHIGASFDIPLHVIWGNTIRDFGMYPYRSEQEEVFQYEVDGLSCRPCSKIGHQSCPKGHFDCMRKQDLNKIATAVNCSTPSLQ